MVDVEKEITGGLFGALSTLLAITLAAFSAFWALHVKLSGEASSEDYGVLEGRKKKYRVYRRCLWCLLSVVVALVAILSPSFGEVVSNVSPDLPFSTVRALLFLFYVLLVGAVGVAIAFICKFTSRMSDLQKEITSLKQSQDCSIGKRSA